MIDTARVAAVAPVLDAWADALGLPRDVLYGIVQTESGFDPDAVGDNGASWGLMQVQVPTAAGLGFTGTGPDLLDPNTNIQWGATYLRRMLDRFNGDITSAISAYNAGPGGVGTNPGYIAEVQANASDFDTLWDAVPSFGTVAAWPTWATWAGLAGLLALLYFAVGGHV